jgi:hypothetical protein
LKNKSNSNSGTSNNDAQGHIVFISKDVTLTILSMKNNFSNDMWILDSGASCHYCQTVEGSTEVKKIDASIKIGNCHSMKATAVGNLKCEVTQINGENFTETLIDVKYVPSFCVNLSSLNNH